MLLAMLLAAPAYAIEFRWWGIGPTFGTRIVPLQYPIYPKAADGFDTIEGNFEAGIKTALYAGNIGRVQLRGEIGGDFSIWRSEEFTFGWDQLLVKDGELQLLLGGQVGVGHERTFSAEGENPYWDVQYFPIRAELGGLLRDKWRGYELDLWGAWHIVGKQENCASDGDCTSPADLADGVAFYAGVGVEATIFFGSFYSAKEK